MTLGLVCFTFSLTYLQIGHEETVRVNNRQMKIKILSQIPYIFGKFENQEKLCTQFVVGL